MSCSLLSPVRLDFVESMSGRERFERGAQNPENGMKASSSKMGLCLRSTFLTRLKTWKLRLWANITQWAEGTVRVSPAICASFDSCMNFSFLSSGAFVYICFAWIHMDFPWFTLQVTGMPETRLGFSYVLHCASNIFSQMLMAERLNGWTSWYFFSFVGCSQKIHKALGWGHWRTWNEIRLSKLSFRIACLNACNRWYRWAHAYACI